MALSQTTYANSSVTCEPICDARENEKESVRRAEAGDGLGVITTKTDRRVRGSGRLVRERNLLDEWSDRRKRDQARGMWEAEAEKRNVRTRIKREVEKAEAAFEEDLKRRRNRLSELLRSEEEENYSQLLEQKQEGNSAAASRMLARYLQLRTRREEERQKLAQEKREQQFKRDCAELRAALSRRLEQETAGERKILEEEERRRRRRREEEDGEMWRKEDEEREEERERRRRGMEWGEGVEEQMRERKERERRERTRKEEEEAEIRAEQMRLLRVEAESAVEAKRRKQEAARRDLDECVKAKWRTRAKEAQEDIMEDIFFLAMAQDEEDRTRKIEKKQCLMREQRRFLEYVGDCGRREAELERDLEEVCDREAEKKRTERRTEEEEEKRRKGKAEMEAADQLRTQITDNLEKWRNAQCVNREYAERVMSEDQEDRRREKERWRVRRERNTHHQKELEDQIREKHGKQDRRVAEEGQEAVRRAREQEEDEIRRLVAEMDIDRPHPYRAGRKNAFDDCSSSRH